MKVSAKTKVGLAEGSKLLRQAHEETGVDLIKIDTEVVAQRLVVEMLQAEDEILQLVVGFGGRQFFLSQSRQRGADMLVKLVYGSKVKSVGGELAVFVVQLQRHLLLTLRHLLLLALESLLLAAHLLLLAKHLLLLALTLLLLIDEKLLLLLADELVLGAVCAHAAPQKHNENYENNKKRHGNGKKTCAPLGLETINVDRLRKVGVVLLQAVGIVGHEQLLQLTVVVGTLQAVVEGHEAEDVA